MNHKSLREAAKFCAGLVAADLFTIIWLWSSGLFPLVTWGITWSTDVVLPSVVFDAALLIILIHYGWHLGKIPRMRERTYLLVAGIIFTVVAAAHLARVFAGADVAIMGWSIPLWLSWIGTLVAAYLAYSSFHFALRNK